MSKSFSKRDLILSIVIMVAVIALFAVLIDWQQVMGYLRAAQVSYLLGAFGLLLLGLVVYAERWRTLMNRKAGWWITFHAANASNLINLLLPVRPGEPARILMVSQESHLGLAETTSSVVVERWLEQVMRLGAFGGALVFGAGLQISPLTVAGALVLLAASLGFMLWMVGHPQTVLETWPAVLARLPRLDAGSVRSALAELLRGLASVSSPRLLVLGFLWSVATWALFWGGQYLALLALNAGLSTETMLAISLGALALAPPSAPAMPGIYQASVVAPLALVGFDESILTAYAVINQALQLLAMTPLGAWGLSRGGVSLRHFLQARQQQGESQE